MSLDGVRLRVVDFIASFAIVRCLLVVSVMSLYGKRSELQHFLHWWNYEGSDLAALWITDL